MVNEISLKFRLMKSDLVSATRAQMFQSIIVRIIVVICIGGLILAAVGSLFFGLDPSNVASQILLMLTLGFLLPISGPIVLLRLRREAKVFEEQSWSFTDSEVSVRTHDYTSKLAWSSFNKTSDSGSFYYLYLTNRLPIIIPKRAFVTKDQEIAFRNLVKQRTRNNLK